MYKATDDCAKVLHSHCSTKMREYIVNQCREELTKIMEEDRSKSRDEAYKTIHYMTDKDVCEAIKCHTAYTEDDFVEWVVSIYSINHRDMWDLFDLNSRRHIWNNIARQVATTCLNTTIET